MGFWDTFLEGLKTGVTVGTLGPEGAAKFQYLQLEKEKAESYEAWKSHDAVFETAKQIKDPKERGKYLYRMAMELKSPILEQAAEYTPEDDYEAHQYSKGTQTIYKHIYNGNPVPVKDLADAMYTIGDPNKLATMLSIMNNVSPSAVRKSNAEDLTKKIDNVAKYYTFVSRVDPNNQSQVDEALEMGNALGLDPTFSVGWINKLHGSGLSKDVYAADKAKYEAKREALLYSQAEIALDRMERNIDLLKTVSNLTDFAMLNAQFGKYDLPNGKFNLQAMEDDFMLYFDTSEKLKADHAGDDYRKRFYIDSIVNAHSMGLRPRTEKEWYSMGRIIEHYYPEFGTQDTYNPALGIVRIQSDYRKYLRTGILPDYATGERELNKEIIPSLSAPTSPQAIVNPSEEKPQRVESDEKLLEWMYGVGEDIYKSQDIPWELGKEEPKKSKKKKKKKGYFRHKPSLKEIILG